jgi:uncharacterized Zn finger protein (UPF0148 family)
MAIHILCPACHACLSYGQTECPCCDATFNMEQKIIRDTDNFNSENRREFEERVKRSREFDKDSM